LVLLHLLSPNQERLLSALECAGALISNSAFIPLLPKGTAVEAHVGNYSSAGGPCHATATIANLPWSLQNPRLTLFGLRALSIRTRTGGLGLVIHYHGARELLRSYAALAASAFEQGPCFWCHTGRRHDTSRAMQTPMSWTLVQLREHDPESVMHLDTACVQDVDMGRPPRPPAKRKPTRRKSSPSPAGHPCIVAESAK